MLARLEIAVDLRDGERVADVRLRGACREDHADDLAVVVDDGTARVARDDPCASASISRVTSVSP